MNTEGAFTVDDGVVLFANYQDQCLYRQVRGGSPEPITSKADMRYADLTVDKVRNRLLAVREDHSGEGEVVNTIVSIDLENHNTRAELVSGNDCYASLRISPNGKQQAWLAWNHPIMPWDGTELWVADIDSDGALSSPRLIASNENESIFQPTCSPDGDLFYISDANGWWNLYRSKNGKNAHLLPMQAECGLPQWTFGMSTYGFLSADEPICAYNQQGTWHLALFDIPSGRLRDIDQPYEAIFGLRANRSQIVFIGASPSVPRSIIQLDRRTEGGQLCRKSSDVPIDSGYLSMPKRIDFLTADSKTAFVFFYPPVNASHEVPANTLPPLLVLCHGGPTSAATSAYNPLVQF